MGLNEKMDGYTTFLWKIMFPLPEYYIIAYNNIMKQRNKSFRALIPLLDAVVGSVTVMVVSTHTCETVSSGCVFPTATTFSAVPPTRSVSATDYQWWLEFATSKFCTPTSQHCACSMSHATASVLHVHFSMSCTCVRHMDFLHVSHPSRTTPIVSFEYCTIYGTLLTALLLLVWCRLWIRMYCSAESLTKEQQIQFLTLNGAHTTCYSSNKDRRHTQTDYVLACWSTASVRYSCVCCIFDLILTLCSTTVHLHHCSRKMMRK